MPGQYIQAINGIEIGENVLIGPGVKIISANHDINNFSVHIKSKPVIVGDNCWLGSNCVLLPGSHLGNHVIVAAGAVVSECFPDDCIIGGVPARILRKIGHYKSNVR
jgi:acetyltransferase-like isoleucine patch superfamily enzyme